MKILLCGADGFLGFPLLLRLLSRGHQVFGVDCFHRRRMVAEMGSVSAIPIDDWNIRYDEVKKRYGDGFTFNELDITDYDNLEVLFRRVKPEAIINLAQQPSPAYSMIDPYKANFTQNNNINGLLNLFWCMRKYAPEAQVVTLGTMGEWGFPHMPIPEGFFQVEYKGYSDVLPFPRQTNSIYHASKVQSSDNAWFACRIWELRATDIHQGVVYGTHTPEMVAPQLRTRFDFDECFGTAINRFVSMAVTENPIIVYGSGLQVRSYIALTDSIECLCIATENFPSDDDSFHGYRVINQFDECYRLNDLAEIVKEIALEFGLKTSVKHIENPRIEAEYHFYEPAHEKLYNLGWQPTKDLKATLREMFEDLVPYRSRLKRYEDKFLPKIKWRK